MVWQDFRNKFVQVIVRGVDHTIDCRWIVHLRKESIMMLKTFRMYLMFFTTLVMTNEGARLEIQLIPDLDQRLLAGESTDFQVALNLTMSELDPNLEQQNRPLNLTLILTTNGTGCVPTQHPSPHCSSLTRFSLPEISVKPLSSTTIQVLTLSLDASLDFSLRHQRLYGRLESPNPIPPHRLVLNVPTTASEEFFTPLSAPISSPVPLEILAQSSTRPMFAGSKSTSEVRILGSGFSRFIHETEIYIRMEDEDSDLNLPKPILTQVSASYTQLVFTLSTSCFGQNLPRLDVALVGNRILITRIRVSGSRDNMLEGLSIPLSPDPIQSSRPNFPVSIMKPLMSFETTLFELSSTEFSCHPASLMNIRLFYSSNNSSIEPLPARVQTYLSLNNNASKLDEVQYRILTQCNVSRHSDESKIIMDGLDVILSGAKLYVQLWLKSKTPQISPFVEITPRGIPLQAPVPEIRDVFSFPRLTPLNLDSSTFQLTGSGMSCHTRRNMISIQPTKDNNSSLVLPMIVNVVQTGSRNRLNFTLITSNLDTDEAFPGFDASCGNSKFSFALSIPECLSESSKNRTSGRFLFPEIVAPRVLDVALDLTTKIKICTEEPERAFARVDHLLVDHVSLDRSLLDIQFFLSKNKTLSRSLVRTTNVSFTQQQKRRARVSFDIDLDSSHRDFLSLQQLLFEESNVYVQLGLNEVYSSPVELGGLGNCALLSDVQIIGNESKRSRSSPSGGLVSGLIAGLVLVSMASLGFVFQLVLIRRRKQDHVVSPTTSGPEPHNVPVRTPQSDITMF